MNTLSDETSQNDLMQLNTLWKSKTDAYENICRQTGYKNVKLLLYILLNQQIAKEKTPRKLLIGVKTIGYLIALLFGLFNFLISAQDNISLVWLTIFILLYISVWHREIIPFISPRLEELIFVIPSSWILKIVPFIFGYFPLFLNMNNPDSQFNNIFVFGGLAFLLLPITKIINIFGIRRVLTSVPENVHIAAMEVVEIMIKLRKPVSELQKEGVNIELK